MTQLSNQSLVRTDPQHIKLPNINPAVAVNDYEPEQYGKFTEKLQLIKNRRKELFKKKNAQAINSQFTSPMSNRENVKTIRGNIAQSVESMKLNRI